MKKIDRIVQLFWDEFRERQLTSCDLSSDDLQPLPIDDSNIHRDQDDGVCFIILKVHKNFQQQGIRNNQMETNWTVKSSFLKLFKSISLKDPETYMSKIINRV